MAATKKREISHTHTHTKSQIFKINNNNSAENRSAEKKRDKVCVHIEKSVVFWIRFDWLIGLDWIGFVVLVECYFGISSLSLSHFDRIGTQTIYIRAHFIFFFVVLLCIFVVAALLSRCCCGW